MPAPPEAPPSQAAILVVDDNEGMRLGIAYALEDDYQVDTAATPEETLTLVAQKTYGVVLLDISLGCDKDGVQLLRELRDTPAYGPTPTIALTAHALPGDRERFLSVGFDDYASKPFTYSTLVSLVQRHLQGR